MENSGKQMQLSERIKNILKLKNNNFIKIPVNRFKNRLNKAEKRISELEESSDKNIRNEIRKKMNTLFCSFLQVSFCKKYRGHKGGEGKLDSNNICIDNYLNLF